MEQVVLVCCMLAAQRAGSWGPWAAPAGAHGTQDAAPLGGYAANLITTLPYAPTLMLFLLRVSQSPVVQSVSSVQKLALDAPNISLSKDGMVVATSSVNGLCGYCEQQGHLPSAQ